jgi:hypothetical protein
MYPPLLKSFDIIGYLFAPYDRWRNRFNLGIHACTSFLLYSQKPLWARGFLAAFYLQAAVLGQGYYNTDPLCPVGQDLGGLKDFKGGGYFPGGKDYPAPLYPAGYALLPFQRYFVY